LAAGKSFDPTELAIVGADKDGSPIIGKVPNMRTLNVIKKGFDELLEGYRSPVTGKLMLDERGRAINDVRKEFIKELDAINPDYKTARAAWSGPSTSMDAMKRGESFARLKPEQIEDDIKNLLPGDKEFYKLGVADSLKTAIAKKGVSADEAKAIIGNDYTRSKLRPLFDDQAAYEKFIRSVEAEGRMFNTQYEVLGNSRTAARLAEDGSPMIDAGINAARAAGAANRMDVIALGRHSLNALADLRRLRDPARNAEMAKIIGTPFTSSSAGMDLLRSFARNAPEANKLLNKSVMGQLPP
jgi:hypothetical protein